MWSLSHCALSFVGYVVFQDCFCFIITEVTGGAICHADEKWDDRTLYGAVCVLTSKKPWTVTAQWAQCQNISTHNSNRRLKNKQAMINLHYLHTLHNSCSETEACSLQLNCAGFLVSVHVLCFGILHQQHVLQARLISDVNRYIHTVRVPQALGDI